MLTFKSIVLGIFLSTPMIAGAATTLSLESTQNNTSPTAVAHSNPVDPNDYSALIFGNSASLNDTWSLNVAVGEQAEVVFSALDFGSPTFLISNFQASNTVLGSSFSFSNLAAGTYQFVISGLTGSFGGAYSVNTTVTSVPLPSAALLMGSAMVGLFSFKKRKAASIA